MAYAKVILNGTTLMDVTQDTVTTSTLISGITATQKDGVQITGTASNGMTIGPTDYSITLTNKRSSTIAVNRVTYKSNTILCAASANLATNASGTYNDMATDGTHVWFIAPNISKIMYNGAQATYVRESFSYMLTIPEGFDGTIPFELYTS